MNQSYRAIETNSFNGNTFPINIDFSVKDNFYRIYLMPISVREIIEIIPFDRFLVFNVDHCEYDGHKIISFFEVLDKYASYLEKFDDETFLIKKTEISRLLDEISHYNLCLIDVDLDIDIEKLIQIIDLSDKWSDEITIIKEVNQNFFLSSHDDCYLYFETNDKNLALEIMSLQIKTLVSTVSEDCPFEQLKFNPKKFLNKNEFSILIPQNHFKTEEKISWKILDGKFKEFIYENEPLPSHSELIYFKATNEIKIKKVRSQSTPDFL